MTQKRIYRFSAGGADGKSEQRALLGGKGANLAEMANLGIPVPPGFTITTEVCAEYYREGRCLPRGLREQILASMSWLEKETGRRFGDSENPLLVSVRSGARASMPGMMDTILNLGLNDATTAGLAKRTSNERFAYDAYRRLLTMYGNVVLGADHHEFESSLTQARARQRKAEGLEPIADKEELARLVPDSALSAESLRDVVKEYKGIVQRLGAGFPESPLDQLLGAIIAVFSSWNNERAILYRRMHQIPDDWGTAVNVQAMVFGNLGETSATGVAFTRDPSTGEKRFFGEWLPNAQGEDVVAGIRTPRPLAKTTTSLGKSLEEALPESYRELFVVQEKLETHFRDMQDIEFTVEDGRLYLLQTRNGKRSARADVRIAVEMVREKLIDEPTALLRVEAHRLEELLFPSVDPKTTHRPFASGLPASPGAVTGRAVFSANEAELRANQGEKVILVRTETSPEDLHGMKAAVGILTARGGATSHAAVVARGMGRSCVVGCMELNIDYELQLMSAQSDDHNVIVRLGDEITIDGSSGKVYLGDVPKVEAGLGRDVEQLMGWADKARRMRVRANADTPAQAKQARSFGAEGIGLCRTEHMFFDEDRLPVMREMILASTVAEREAALGRLLPFQISDFVELFRAMEGLPVNIRLLDPPLHEFLPQEQVAIESMAKTLDISEAELHRKVEELSEFNPMLGHRGVRLAISYPEICEMQFRAILHAACTVQKEGRPVLPEIMIPLAFGRPEVDKMESRVRHVARQVFTECGVTVEYKFGTMIELPRAALQAHEIAQIAEFFSFGTNDLTQTTLGLSRDDSGKFLPDYVQYGILPLDPFVSIDRDGVGELVRLACDGGRKVRAGISLGICGEHGGDPSSIEFFEEVGLDYVSCSPFRVPIARLATAQSALRAKKSR